MAADAEEPALTPAKRRKAVVRRWVLWGTLVASMWGFLWYVLPQRPGDAVGEAESRAVEALELVGKALHEHMTTAGKLPASLEALSGETFEQAREAARSAQAMGYRLEYLPGPEENGAARAYVLLARPNNHGYRSFWSNESGSIRWTREDRAATAQDQAFETGDGRR